jgi:hypothetical protein
MPYRNELKAAHAKIAYLEAKIIKQKDKYKIIKLKNRRTSFDYLHLVIDIILVITGISLIMLFTGGLFTC